MIQLKDRTPDASGAAVQRDGLFRLKRPPVSVLPPRAWRRCLSAAALSLTAMTAFAGSTTSTVLSYGSEGNAFRFKLAVPIVSPPACATLGQFAVSLDTNVGRSIADQIIAAKASNFIVTIIGQGYCSALPTTEDVRYVAVSGNSAPPASPTVVGTYWAPSQGATTCISVCNFTGGFGAATATGVICKGQNGTPGIAEWSIVNQGFQCGAGGAGSRTAQCSCARP